MGCPSKAPSKIPQRCAESSSQNHALFFLRCRPHRIKKTPDAPQYKDTLVQRTARSYIETAAPEGKKKQEILIPAPQVAGSCGILYSKPAAQELPCLGFLRRMLPVPAEYSRVNLQHRTFHVLGSCAACCWLPRNTL